MSNKKYSKIYEVATNSDTRVSLQIAKVTITGNQRTRRINEEACLTLKDLDGKELFALLTRDQLNGFAKHDLWTGYCNNRDSPKYGSVVTNKDGCTPQDRLF